MGPRRALGVFLFLVSVCSVFATFGSVTVVKNAVQPESSIDISWVWSGDAGATFQVMVTDTASSTTTPHAATVTSHTVVGLTSSTTYTVKLVATLTNGSTVESAEESVTTGIPSPVVTVKGGSDPTKEAEVSWTYDGDPLTQFNVSLTLTFFFNRVALLENVKSPRTVKVNSGRQYEVMVSARLGSHTSVGVAYYDAVAASTAATTAAPTTAAPTTSTAAPTTTTAAPTSPPTTTPTTPPPTTALPAPSITKVELIGDRQTQIQVTWLGTGASHTVTVTEVTPGTFTRTEPLTASPATVSGLSAGHKYNVIVTAVSGSQREDSAPKLIVTEPVAPTGVLHSNPASVAETQLVIKWTFTRPVDEFDVCINGTCSTETAPPSGNTGTHNSATLTPGGQYPVTVAAVTKLGSLSATSDAASATLATKPLKPGSLTFEEGKTEITVKWECQSSDQLEKYIVTIGCTATSPRPSPVDVPRGTCQHKFTGLTSGDTCTFTVVAETLGVTSEIQTDKAGTNPLSPGITTVTAMATSVAVVWTHPGGQLTKYHIKIMNSTGNGLVTEVKNVGGSYTSQNVPGLSAATDYVVHVVSVSSNDQQSSPATQAFSTLPAAVDSVAFQDARGTHDLTMEWTQPSNVNDPDSFTVWLTDKSNIEVVGSRRSGISSSAKDYPFTGLTPGALYQGYIEAVFKGKSGTSLATLREATKPSPPTKASPSSYSSTTTSVTIMWQHLGLKTGFNASLGGLDRTAGQSDTQVTFNNLQEGQAFTITLVAISHSQESAKVTFTANTKPNQPTQLSSSSQTKTSLKFTWEAPMSGAVGSYEVELSTDNFNTVLKTERPSGTTATFTALNAGSGYSCRVRAESNGEFSDYTSVISVYTKPEGVADLTIDSVTETAARATWQTPGGSVSRYEIDINPKPSIGSFPATINTGTLEYSFSGLNPGATYTVYLTTFAGTAQGNTTTQAFTTCPNPVTGLTATTVDTATVDLQWTVDGSAARGNVEIEVVETGGKLTESVGAAGVMRKSIIGLSAGRIYNFKLTTKKNSVGCKVEVTSGKTEPSVPDSATPTNEGTTTVDIVIIPGSSSTQIGYKVEYRVYGSISNWTPATGNLVPVGVTTVPLFGLTPGQRYDFTTIVTSNGVDSSAIPGQFQLKPKEPTNLQVVASTTTTSQVTVTWDYDSSASHHTQFKIEYTRKQGGITSDNGNVPNVPAGARTRAVTGLKSGVEYEFTIVAESVIAGDTTTSALSTPVSGTVKPRLDGQCQLQEDEGKTDETTVTAEIKSCKLDTTQGYTSGFKVTVEESDGTLVNTTTLGAEATEVTFDAEDGVEPGYRYTLHIYALSGTLESSSMTGHVYTKPSKPIVELGASPTEITVHLKEVAGLVVHYDICVQKTNISTGCFRSENQSYPPSIRLRTFSSLTPHTNYKVTVKYYGEGKSKLNIYSQSTSTKESVPGDVDSLEPDQDDKETMPRSVTIEWSRPSLPNGVITRFHVVIKEGGRTVFTDTVTADSRQTPYSVVADLQPGEVHSVKVFAENNAGNGTFTLKPYTPDKIEPQKAPDAAEKKPRGAGGSTTSSFTVELDRSFVTSMHGKVVKYQVIVKSPGNSGLENENAANWYKARPDEKASIPYITSKPCNFFDPQEKCADVQGISRLRRNANSNTVLYRVGASACPARAPGQTGKVYCNGPVSTDSGYIVKLRAFTSADPTKPLLYTDSAYSLPIKTAAEEKKGPNTGAIAGGVVAALVAVGVVVGAGFFMWRRRNKPDRAQPMNLGHPDPIPMEKRSNPIRLKEFEAHYANMSKDSDFLFASEYEELKPVGETQSKTAANVEENRAKNRFINILPYDHSRVKLQPLDDDNVQGSDYINASYMPGYNSKREFIVTQGPLPATCDDFWRMVWEQKCRAIVMLTRCMEKNKVKCHHYWPDNTDPVAYGDIEVAILNETKTLDWNITKMKMVNMKDNESRTITHFHYVAWPDFGVPENHQSLIRFVRTVRGRVTRDGGPIIVHCSAGVGRSGTFIVLDRTLQHIRENDTVDVFASVAEMRLQRSLMVQTEAQYVLIHKCLLCVARGEENSDENGGSTNPAFLDDEGITVEIS